MLSGALLAEMPQRLRQAHRRPGTTDGDVVGKKDTAAKKVAPIEKAAPHRRRGHVRQNAMVWDDLVSVVRVEVMKAERSGVGVGHSLKWADAQEPSDTHSSYPAKAATPFDLDDEHEHDRATSALGRIARRFSPPVVRRLSPPVVKGTCDDGPPSASFNRAQTSTLGRIARRMSPPVVATARMVSFGFGRGGSDADASDNVSAGCSSRTHCESYFSGKRKMKIGRMSRAQ